MYSPVAEIEPALDELSDHVTSVAMPLVNVGVNCWVAPAIRFADAGDSIRLPGE